MKKSLSLVALAGTFAGIATTITSCGSEKKIEAIMFMDKTTDYSENSFSQGIYKGFKDHVNGSTYMNVKDDNETGRSESIQDGVDKGMKYAVLASYGFQDNINKLANLHKDVKFIGADFKVDSPAANVASAWISIESSAFLGGYATAAFLNNLPANDPARSDGLKVGIIGGFGFKTVTDYFEGFLNGVKYANAHHETIAGTEAWVDITKANPDSQLKAYDSSNSVSDGWWTSSWDPSAQSYKDKFQQLVAAHADAIIGAEGMVWDHNKNSTDKIYAIGADKDMMEDAKAVGQQDYLITSIIKDLGHKVDLIIQDDKAGGTKYFGKAPVSGDIKDGSSNIAQNLLSKTIFDLIQAAITDSKTATPTNILTIAALNTASGGTNFVDGAFTTAKA